MRTYLARFKLISIIAIILLVVAGCQSSDSEETSSSEENAHDHEHDHNESNHDVPEEVNIVGLSDHYHTDDTIDLAADLEEETSFEHWHWYTRNSADDEWEVDSEQSGMSFISEATLDGQEIKAVLYNDDHEPHVQSAPIVIHIDDHDDHHHHGHAHDEESEQIYNGYFEDDQIEDRMLSDWEGDWQSVYPYLLDGSLDEVFEHKAEHSEDMTAEEYREYYAIGYETEVDRIVIEGDGNITFYENDEALTGEYVQDGYEILTYEKGNRGVRFIFKLESDVDGLPEYIQFSDHSIFPTDAHHFHLYWGDDREALLDEVTNWPTYYPSDMDDHDIVHEMIAH